MGQYWFAGWRLSFVVCNTAGMRAGRPPGSWAVGAPAAGYVGDRAADTAVHGGPVRLRPVRATPC